MSFFSKIFRGYDEPDNTEEIKETPAQQETAFSSSPISQLEEGMVLDVSTGGTHLLSGRVTELTGRRVTLERNVGQLSFPSCKPGTPVTVRTYLRDSSLFDFEGTVEESSRTRLRIQNCRTIVHNEKRDNFRVSLNIPMEMYYPEDKGFENPEQCTLLDLSSGGACVESEFIHGEGEILQLRMRIDKYAPMTFLSEVIRVQEPQPGVFQYGVLFAQLDAQTATSLTRILFNIQVGNKDEKRGANYGRRT